ncbi:MAG TPA: ferritin-like domain-containing protein [Gaiellaceae bacterium]|jgi:rubrerythrin|nr:ferritin-like domain-containing protein [Gaiellaceae bacterium]
MTQLNYKGIPVETDAPLDDMVGRLEESRAGFLQKAAIFGGGVAAVASGAMAFPSTARASKASDAEILNFALTLEYLEASFYAIAVDKAPLDNRARRLARVIRDHELAHVDALVKTIRDLGGTPIRRPEFQFLPNVVYANQQAFLQTAMALEDTGVGAYNGAGPALTVMAVKAAAASIVAVEGMHAAWVRGVAGTAPAPEAFDPLLTKEQVLAAAGPFIA